jgi:hypothetical protein
MSAVFFLKFLVIKTQDPDWIVVPYPDWIRIRIRIRFHWKFWIRAIVHDKKSFRIWIRVCIRQIRNPDLLLLLKFLHNLGKKQGLPITV